MSGSRTSSSSSAPVATTAALATIVATTIHPSSEHVHNRDLYIEIESFEEKIDIIDGKKRVFYSILVDIKHKAYKYFVEKSFTEFKDLFESSMSNPYLPKLKDFDFPSKYSGQEPSIRLPKLNELLNLIIEGGDLVVFRELNEFLQLAHNLGVFEAAEAQRRADEEEALRRKAEIEAELRRLEELRRQAEIEEENKRIAEENARIAEAQRKANEEAELKKKAEGWFPGKNALRGRSVSSEEDRIEVEGGKGNTLSGNDATNYDNNVSLTSTATSTSSQEKEKDDKGWYPGKFLKRGSISKDPPTQAAPSQPASAEVDSKSGKEKTIKTSPPGFFLNINLLNKEDVVAAKVGEKLETKGISKGGLVGRATSFAANKLVKEEKVVDTLAETMITKISEQTEVMGIKANVTKRFQLGSFVVLRVVIDEIDKLKLIVGAKGPEFATNFSTLLECLAELGIDKTATIDERIASLVLDGMMKKFEEMVPKKMKESGLLVECSVVSVVDQADHFYALLEKLS